MKHARLSNPQLESAKDPVNERRPYLFTSLAFLLVALICVFAGGGHAAPFLPLSGLGLAFVAGLLARARVLVADASSTDEGGIAAETLAPLNSINSKHV